MSSENSSDFKKLIKEVGIRKAIEIMKEKGIVYSGDFTVDHRTDSFFSCPNVFENQKMNNSLDCSYDIVYSSIYPSGNLFLQNSYLLSNPVEKIPYPNSIFNVIDLTMVSNNHLESQETTSGLMLTPSPKYPTANR